MPTMQPNVGAALKQSLNSPPLAHGVNASVHVLGAPIPDRFLLRARADAWHASSALTPLAHIPAGIQVGQPIMANADRSIDILLTQPGISFKQWAMREEDPRIADRLLVETLEDFTKRGTNPFVKILNETYELGKLGYACDPGAGNILIDTQDTQLHLVDQCDAFHAHCDLGEANLTRFVHALPDCIFGPRYRENIHDPHAGRLYETWRAKITAMVADAYAQVQAKHREDTPASKLGFTDVRAVQAVALSDPPRQLVRQLEALERHVQHR